MKTYLGVKLIKAGTEMSRKEYCDYRGWDVPADENGEDRVYLVEYEPEEGKESNHPNHEGYISMSPKDVFEKAYREVDALTFGLATEALRKGLCVARKGWNGKGMFVCKQIPSNISADVVPKMQSLPQKAKDQIMPFGISYRNQLLIVKDRVADSWVPSSSDIFAEDWYIVE